MATSKDEVSLRVSRGGPIQTTSPGTEDEIPLSNATFTQRAGEALLLIAQAQTTESRVSSCSVFVNVEDSTDAALMIEDAADRGSVGGSTEHELLPAPSSNVLRTLRAFAVEGESCDAPDQDTWTVSINLSVVNLRN